MSLLDFWVEQCCNNWYFCSVVEDQEGRYAVTDVVSFRPARAG